MRTVATLIRGSIGLALLTAPVLAQDSPPKAQPLKPRTVEGISWNASGRNGAVTAGGAEAVAAGLEILKSDGTAGDAAVATILALSVTDAGLFCFGGEVPVLAYDAKSGRTEVIAGQGVAPRLATAEYFKKYETLPIQGLDVAAVPATLDACVVLLERHGTKTFAEVAAPTLKLLERGEQPWHADLAATLQLLIAAEKSSSDRSVGLRRVADRFYRGDIARSIDRWSRENGGLLRFEDLATHVTRIEEPVTATYRGLTVSKCGAWTQGPALLQTLQILEEFDFSGKAALEPAVVHACVEALKLGLADRDQYYADPLFVDVPLKALLNPDYARERMRLIDRDHASLVLRPGNPRSGEPLLETCSTDLGNLKPNDTTTCLVADRWGNVIAATPSGWSGVLVGDTGVWLGSRLQSFRKEPDHPNAIAPGKRPRITLTPTLVFQEGKPVYAVSVAGGDLQDQVTLQLLVDMIDFGMSPKDAVTAPRYSTDHHIGSFAQAAAKLGSLSVNSSLEDATVRELEGLGHTVTRSKGAVGNPVVLRIDPNTHVIEAAGDPKSARHAAAY
jgi:gamma-glutamyltranspeptidase/glutathione hydrolase